MKRVCDQCKNEFEDVELVVFDKERLCRRCKDYTVQRLREGVGNEVLSRKGTLADTVVRFIWGMLFGIGIVALVIGFLVMLSML